MNQKNKPKEMSYSDYLRSECWHELRERAKARDGYRCRICNKSNTKLAVHHRVYSRSNRGNELDDLTTVCTRCHKVIHTHIIKVAELSSKTKEDKTKKKNTILRRKNLFRLDHRGRVIHEGIVSDLCR